MEENKFRCTGEWNGEKFDLLVEANSEADCHIHFMYWSCAPGVKLENLQVNRVVH